MNKLLTEFFDEIQSKEFKESVKNDYDDDIHDAITQLINDYFYMYDDINHIIINYINENRDTNEVKQIQDAAFFDLIEQAQELYNKKHEEQNEK